MSVASQSAHDQNPWQVQSHAKTEGYFWPDPTAVLNDPAGLRNTSDNDSNFAINSLMVNFGPLHPIRLFAKLTSSSVGGLRITPIRSPRWSTSSSCPSGLRIWSAISFWTTIRIISWPPFLNPFIVSCRYRRVHHPGTVIAASIVEENLPPRLVTAYLGN